MELVRQVRQMPEHFLDSLCETNQAHRQMPDHSALANEAKASGGEPGEGRRGSYPGLQQEKKAWYTLFVHARN